MLSPAQRVSRRQKILPVMFRFTDVTRVISYSARGRAHHHSTLCPCATYLLLICLSQARALCYGSAIRYRGTGYAAAAMSFDGTVRCYAVTESYSMLRMLRAARRRFRGAQTQITPPMPSDASAAACLFREVRRQVSARRIAVLHRSLRDASRHMPLCSTSFAQSTNMLSATCSRDEICPSSFSRRVEAGLRGCASVVSRPPSMPPARARCRQRAAEEGAALPRVPERRGRPRSASQAVWRGGCVALKREEGHAGAWRHCRQHQD